MYFSLAVWDWLLHFVADSNKKWNFKAFTGCFFPSSSSIWMFLSFCHNRLSTVESIYCCVPVHCPKTIKALRSHILCERGTEEAQCRVKLALYVRGRRTDRWKYLRVWYILSESSAFHRVVREGFDYSKDVSPLITKAPSVWWPYYNPSWHSSYGNIGIYRLHLVLVHWSLWGFGVCVGTLYAPT